jgi:uncharacterized protein YaaN involved in tellurite resistance
VARSFLRRRSSATTEDHKRPQHTTQRTTPLAKELATDYAAQAQAAATEFLASAQEYVAATVDKLKAATKTEL